MNDPAAQLPETTLRLSRYINASPDEVYAAWTLPDRLKRWFSPGPDTKSLLTEIDLKIGGRYRIGFDSPEHGVNYVGGEYREVVPNQKLVYTWVWEKPHEFAGVNTLVTVQFNKMNNGTELVVIHENLTTETMHQTHAWGWNGALDQLAGILPGDK